MEITIDLKNDKIEQLTKARELLEDELEDRLNQIKVKDDTATPYYTEMTPNSKAEKMYKLIKKNGGKLEIQKIKKLSLKEKICQEKEFDTILNNLKRMGEVFEARRGIIQCI